MFSTSFQIIFNSIAYETGLKDRDYVVEINNTKVFEMSHDDCKDLIRKAGDHLQIKIERWESGIFGIAVPC